MAIRIVLLAVVMSIMPLWSGSAAAADTAKQVLLVSEEWIDYTNRDGSGLAWDILREVFEPAGVRVVIQSAPYSRAVGLVKRGEADAWVGSYRNEVEDNLYPRWHFDMDHIYALGLASRAIPEPEKIGQYRLAWVRGYDYASYLPKVKSFREIQRREGILPMLEHDRVDFYIDAQTEVDYVLSQTPDPQRFRSTHIAELPLYLAFTRNERSKSLIELFDRRMAALVRSGELKAIFDKWQQPYPFTADSTPQ